jgi:Kef-type K+ transport system membrane component KefB
MKINLNKIPIVFQLLLLLVFVYGNIFLLEAVFSLEEKWKSTYYTFYQTFSFFAISSIVILLLNLAVQKKAKDQLGFVFLGIMTVKVIAAYIFIAPALELKTASSQFEKNNFFIYFLTFLAIDVYLTAQILNKKN